MNKPIVIKCQCKHCSEEIRLGQKMLSLYFSGFIHEKCRDAYNKSIEGISGIEGKVGEYIF